MPEPSSPGIIDGASTPLVANTDKEAIALALRGCPKVDPIHAKLARIRNTLELSEIWLSETMREEIEAHPRMEIISAVFPFLFWPSISAPASISSWARLSALSRQFRKAASKLLPSRSLALGSAP